MSGKNETDNCDLCYLREALWNVEMRHRAAPAMAVFRACDACQKVIVDVVAPILHRLSHDDLVQALVDKCNQKGITIADIMDPSAWRGQGAITQ